MADLVHETRISRIADPFHGTRISRIADPFYGTRILADQLRTPRYQEFRRTRARARRVARVPTPTPHRRSQPSAPGTPMTATTHRPASEPPRRARPAFPENQQSAESASR